MQYGLISYSYHAVPYMPSTYLSYNGKFVTFDLFQPSLPPLIPTPSLTTSLLCFLGGGMVLLFSVSQIMRSCHICLYLAYFT